MKKLIKALEWLGDPQNNEDCFCAEICLEAAGALMDRTWIRVDENLPVPEREVLVCTKSKNGTRNVDKGRRIEAGGQIIWSHRGCAEVTHWLPIYYPEDD